MKELVYDLTLSSEERIELLRILGNKLNHATAGDPDAKLWLNIADKLNSARPCGNMEE